MEKLPAPIHTVAMNQAHELLSQIYDEAVELAHSAFEDPTMDHVEGVYQRLLLNATWGVGEDGAVTIH